MIIFNGVNYDKYGNPKYVMLNMPYNSTAEGVNPVYIPEESDMYKKIMERSSSTFCDRMKNVDWQTLEKDYGNKPEFQKAQKRFLEEEQKQPGLIQTLSNFADKYAEKIVNFIDPNTKGGIEK